MTTPNPYQPQDLHARVENDFRNHPPASDVVGALMDAATERFVAMAHWIADAVPAGREQSSALTKLEECSMNVKAGIARNQDRVDPTLATKPDLGTPGLPEN